ncbi:NUDIX hydrolase [Actinophytocola xanthii]|uniref:NUDIX hydrolase n=1 Tax=Actinophytocola xanthii TaxID=1912961 RepID=A0A1Q8C7S0_9PSEU|nr:NUDIX domain-containing protein [Actinophytocola xanthii]OLF10386.1 NUDIX hydrolase [Actinophytocola xanthii]
MPVDQPWEIPLVAVAVDLAILTVRSGRLEILLVRRGIEPYLGSLALPGGFLASPEEDLDAAAARELTEETGLAAKGLHLEQLGAYGAPDRDPRGRVVTVCYLALMPDLPLPVAGGDARSAEWVPVQRVLRRRAGVAFDHAKIIKDAVERARSKLEYTTLATAFCSPEFSVSELRRVYEIVWGQPIDPRNFHRKVTSIEDFLVPTGKYTTRDGGRPAALYRRGSATLLHPAILRNGTGRRQLARLRQAR